MTIDLAKTAGSSPPDDSLSTSCSTLIHAWFDGACEPKNPGGHAVWGVVVHVDGQNPTRKSGCVGSGQTMSNNVAEYAGCIAALEEIQKHSGNAILYGDSQLVIEQLSQRWRVKSIRKSTMPLHPAV